MLFFREMQLRGQYPMFQDFFTVFMTCECIAFSSLIAGILKRTLRVS